MKNVITISIVLFALVARAQTGTRINPVIGDQSYILKYGVVPNENTDDHQRIAAHLEYAEFVLRSKDVSGLSTKQIEKRTHLLDLLHEYWTRGIFPRNDDHKNDRRPCFIDYEGTICAVGYLVEQTAGRDVAELINERFMYNEILDMNDPIVMNWIEECGLTREECAIIQPSYGDKTDPRTVVSYGGSYRVSDYFYHTFRLMYETNDGLQWQYYGDSYYRGLGVQYDWFFNGDFSAGIRYSRELTQQYYSGQTKSAKIALMPEIFVFNRQCGFNLKPEIEVSRYFGEVISLSASYSYAIPITNQYEYRAGRHDFAVRIGINLGSFGTEDHGRF